MNFFELFALIFICLFSAVVLMAIVSHQEANSKSENGEELMDGKAMIEEQVKLAAMQNQFLATQLQNKYMMEQLAKENLYGSVNSDFLTQTKTINGHNLHALTSKIPDSSQSMNKDLSNDA